MATKAATPVHCVMLKEELQKRLKHNASYSARAMARDIGVTPAYLSQILVNNRRPGFARAFDIGTRLGWSAQKIRDFVASVQKSQIKKSNALEILEGPNKDVLKQIDDDQARLASEWYHFVIVELTTLADFKSQPKWIADRLGISLFETRNAIERLIRVGLLESKRGRLVKTHKKYIWNKTPSKMIRKSHAQILDRAKLALDQQTSEEREFVSLVLGIKQHSIAKARQLIDKFYLEFMDIVEEDPADAIYHLNIGFFRADVGTKAIKAKES